MHFRNFRTPGTISLSAAFTVATLAASGALFAQTSGPIKPPPSAPSAPQPVVMPQTVAPAEDTPKPLAHSSGGLRNEQPNVPVDQIIQKFAARELEFKQERDNFTYSQTFHIEELDPDGRPSGEYRMDSDIVFTPAGKRYEKVTFAPPPSLQQISLSPQDLQDLEYIQPFVLTTDQLGKYDIKYVGKENVDEINAYVFDTSPKKMEKGVRYFTGRIWVDDKDFEIVKSHGKSTGLEDTKKGAENVSPIFDTYRQNIEGNYWFPVLSRADDVLHFKESPLDVHIRMTVKYSNYKRYGSTIKIKKAPDQP